MTSHTRFQNELSKLTKNVYFDQARISRVQSLTGFNFEFKQIITIKKSIKCYVLSDIHADAEKNQVWVREKCVRSAEDVASDTFTVFIVPGDIGSEVDRIEAVLRNLVANYDAVCFLPGNHEAWRKGTTAAGGAAALASDPTHKRPDNRMATDSVAKLVEVVERARTCGVHVGPLRVQLAAAVEDTPPSAVLVMPLQGWYHSSWDTDTDITDADFLAVEAVVPFCRKWGDYAMCTWPEQLISQRDFVSNPANNTVLAEVFAKLNEPFLHPPPERNTPEFEAASEHPEKFFGSPLAQPSDTVISFSHYLPRLELCPEKRFLTEPMLAKVIGSDVLESQVRRLQPHLHLYGHTHIPLDLELEGIRYLQWPLGYFREAHLQCAPIFSSGPLAVHDSALGNGSAGIPQNLASESAAWSKHYRKEARDPSKVNELAPWVRARLAAYAGMG